MNNGGRLHGVRITAAILALLAVAMTGLVSCGGTGQTTAETPREGMDEGTKLPPGLTGEDLEGLNLEGQEQEAGGSGPGGDEDGTKGSDAWDPRYTAELSGASFTVVDATRNDSNQKVIEANQREVMGDYLEIELAVENVGDELADFSQYSFRLESPSIEADEYRSYYGDRGYLGKYVSEHAISAALLDYADLTPVLYKLKKKEVLEGVFLFFDLNPQSTEENAGFTADIATGNAHLVIHKLWGDGGGKEVRISLAGLAD